VGRFNQVITLIGTKKSRDVEMLVDTGATGTIINKEIADEIGVIPFKAIEATTEAGKAVGYSGIVRAKIDGCEKDIIVSVLKGWGAKLGARTLQRYGAKIDIDKERVYFETCEPFYA